jgi:hypothetical protein
MLYNRFSRNSWHFEPNYEVYTFTCLSCSALGLTPAQREDVQHILKNIWKDKAQLLGAKLMYEDIVLGIIKYVSPVDADIQPYIKAMYGKNSDEHTVRVFKVVSILEDLLRDQ